jgi:putative hydrolase of HD superfamily
VKHAIKTKRPDLFEVLQKKMMNSMLSWKLPDRVYEVFLAHNAYEEDSADSIEKDIFAYAKLVSAYFEAKFQARVYPEIYSKSIDQIQSRMRHPRFEKFTELLDLTQDSGLVKYLLSVRRLESAFRWNRLKRSYPVSVMSHLYLVGVLSFFLFHMEGRSEEEIEEALLRSLLHDVPEAITGDIITPTKKAAPGLDELI